MAGFRTSLPPFVNQILVFQKTHQWATPSERASEVSERGSELPSAPGSARQRTSALCSLRPFYNKRNHDGSRRPSPTLPKTRHVPAPSLGSQAAFFNHQLPQRMTPPRLLRLCFLVLFVALLPTSEAAALRGYANRYSNTNRYSNPNLKRYGHSCHDNDNCPMNRERWWCEQHQQNQKLWKTGNCQRLNRGREKRETKTATKTRARPVRSATKVRKNRH